jgi:hypothetical protein
VDQPVPGHVCIEFLLRSKYNAGLQGLEPLLLLMMLDLGIAPGFRQYQKLLWHVLRLN